ncbi:hypothetical protein BVG16_18665 [Paenibacillus selenitireducens]|uniref:Uncharacterized protein n=1 Tax=Paenibacillus selenitireducens TaxID=1324314 RepID=A0A1T2X8M5_9BACL|nr:DUF5696 domain-containing protein [Paenibacillus selenitireducens]OPA76229.1 hypothetical protein BVG16_18665 [Paenibacillus selenitireducens]
MNMSGKLKIGLGILSAGLVVCGLIALGMPHESVSMDRAAYLTAKDKDNGIVHNNPDKSVKTASAAVGVRSGAGAVTTNSTTELEALQHMKLVAQNETLMLYIREETVEIAVKDKRDGYIWFSNPADREEDSLASPLYKSEMSSQLLVAYYNEKGQINTFNSYDDSVAKKQFQITSTDHGAKVVYQFGKISKSFGNIPKAISKERFEERILGQLDAEKRDNVQYKYRFDDQKQVYEVRKLQDYVAEEISAQLLAIGYTEEEAAKDNEANGVMEAAEDNGPQFTIPIEYVLDGEHLVIQVQAKELQYAKSYPIATLQLLKYFGAAGKNKQGYIFVPDGSGALIHLNNNKKNTETYDLPVYGPDGTYDVKEKVQTNEVTRLPVFGIKQNDHAIIGIIEDGDALASITGDVGGRNDSYNTVASKFSLVAMDFYTLTSGTKTSSVPMFQSAPYQGDYRVRYAFLSGNASDYSGMARKYQEYVVHKYNLKKLKASKDAPFMLEVEGAIQKQKSFLGVPYQSIEPLTTFDEAQSILRTLKERGIHNIDLRYVGWFNDGIRHTSPATIGWNSALGGKRDFQKLTDYVAKENIGFYPDVAFQDKFKGSSGSATFLDGRKAKVYEYDPVMYVKDTAKFSHYVLSPYVLEQTVNGFASKYAKLGVSGLSLRDLGNELNSDFNADHPVNRQEALQIVEKQVGTLKQQVPNLMIDGGNVYNLPYANMIVNAPMRSSRLNLTDEDIPFYQMVLHGYFDMAGEPLNVQRSVDSKVPLLRALETGSNLFYQWIAADSSVVKDSEYNTLYGLHYEDWLDQAVDYYKEANPLIQRIRHQTITGHRQLANHVTETTFEDGTTIVINYNNTSVEVDGQKIDGLSYRVGGE